MSLDDLNREQKRNLRKTGALDAQGRPTRAQPTAKRSEDRVGPVEYLGEVREEMRKVSWARWPEVKRFSIIVLVTVILYTMFIFGLDSLFGWLSGWLYG